MKSVTVPCLLVAVLPLAGSQFQPVRELIHQQLAEGEAVSLAVAVARNGRVVWEEGFGWADRERGVPANQHTMYSLASISKPITATGLMVLVEAGKIDLDRPVNDYLGGAKLRARAGDAAHATVRRVANHTSGLPLHHHFFYFDEPHRPPPMDETIRRYGNLVTAPGEQYQYSNLGYGVLDYVISRVSGKSFPDFMREGVFLPLGMTRASVPNAPRLGESYAVRYGRDGQPLPFYGFDHVGGSAVYASVHDLIRFAMFHLKTPVEGQKPVISRASIDAMQRATAKNGRYTDYGIGWQIAESPNGYKKISHTGGMEGVSTSLRLFPSERLAVAVLANSRTTLPHRISNEIARRMLPRWRETPSDLPRVRRWNPPQQLVGTWSGALHTYEKEIPMTLEVRESGKVRGKLEDQPEALVTVVNWRDGFLSGNMTGNIETEDANRRPYMLRITLKLRGEILNGPATAFSMPGARVGNALTQWVELRRQ